MIVLGSVAVAAEASSSAEPAAEARYVVVAAEGASADALASDLFRWEDQGLFRVDGWPRVVSPIEIGLPSATGALLVAAEVADPAVADRVVKYLSGRGYPARVIQVAGRGPDRRVIWADSLTISGNGAPLYAYDVCLISAATPRPAPKRGRRRGAPALPCLAHARPDPQFGSWFVVSPAPAEELVVVADAGEPWTCRPEAVGRVPDRPVWLHGPIVVSCLAPPVEER